ncbi:MAG: carboxypeptidase-like regulatory domain-containing protein [Clostridium sp.]|nr:carboxypeptidase-like regulatory domain-containing protein [Clostridium sp.]
MKKTKIFFLFLALVIVLSVMITAGIVFAVKLKEDRRAGRDGDEGAGGKLSGVEYGFKSVNRSGLVLSLEKGLFSVGSPETVKFTVLCPEEAETVKILDENDSEVASVENDGNTLLTGSLVIDETGPRFGSLRAVSGDLESQEVYITVAPEISDGMVETLADTCMDVRDYLAVQYPDGKYTDDTVDEVKNHLEQDSRVESVTADGRVVLFRTKDGLMGAVDTSVSEVLSRGGAVSAEDAYVLSREGRSDRETVVLVPSAVTNRRYLYVSPVSDDPIIAYGDVEPERSMEHMASEFGARYEKVTGTDAQDMMLDGSITDSGFLVLSSHGTVVSRKQGGKTLLISIQRYTDRNNTVIQGEKLGEEEKERIKRSLTENETRNETYYGSDKYAENCNLVLAVRDGELSPRLTSTGLENGIGDKRFDNTVVFLGICHSGEDKHLLHFLSTHGASVLFAGEGVMEVSRCSEMFYMLDTLMTEQNPDGTYPTFEEAGLLPTEKELREFRKEWEKIDVSEGEEDGFRTWEELMEDPEENEDEILRKIKSDVAEKEEKNGEENDEILNWLALRNYRETWQSICRSYAEHHDGLEEDREVLMTDYIQGDRVDCYLFAEGKALGGIGTMTGTVTYEEDGLPVRDAEVRFLRWIDHDYELADTCRTDDEGHFEKENLPFGIYAVEASDGRSETHVCIHYTEDNAEASLILPSVSDEDRYYTYLKDTYGIGESDLVSAYIMDFDRDGRKDLLTVTKGTVILANTPLGAFDLYDGNTNAATLDLTMYQLDEEKKVVKTGAILGAGTVEGHSRGTMSVSVILQDGTPYVCGRSTNEDNTTYGANPYVIYEIIEGGGFRYDYVSGISWGQYVMGRSDNKDPNTVAGTYNLDINGTQLSAGGDYGVVLCEASADNINSPYNISAADYTRVKEGMEHGYAAVKGQLDTMHGEMVMDAKAFEESLEKAEDSEVLFEVFVNELNAAGIAPVLEEYRTEADKVTGFYTCQDVEMQVSIDTGSGKLLEIELYANGYPVPASWYPVKDAVLRSSFAGLDQGKIGSLLGQTPTNLSVYNFDAGPAEILAGNAGTIVLRITYR